MKAILNSLIINDGIRTLNVISSSDFTEPSSYPAIFKNVSRSLVDVCLSINVRNGFIPSSKASCVVISLFDNGTTALLYTSVNVGAITNTVKNNDNPIIT